MNQLYKLAGRSEKQRDTVIGIGDITIGEDEFALIAGPCSIENEKQAFETASFLYDRGIRLFRAGAYKPRTSPYSFQGLGKNALDIIRKIKHETDLKVITEAMDIVTINDIADVVDVIQIGSRSMQNFPLLRAAGKLDKPVLLKRGFSATLDELLLSAEYILSEGNSQVILCERGIRTFDQHARNTLDITAIPALKEMTHLPVIVDPSHASGNRKRVLPLSRAALAAGADGIMVEIHPSPEEALSDGSQSLDFDGFDNLLFDMRKLATPMNKKLGVF